MAPISDPAAYCASMAHGVDHKLFFTQYLNLNTLLDYGCADGKVLQEAGERGAVNWGIFYDQCPKMLAKVEPDFWKLITSNEAEAFNSLHSNPEGDSGILFSSVLHEMYSHQPEQMPDFIRERIKQDTGIVLPFDTHLTAIFQKKR